MLRSVVLDTLAEPCTLYACCVRVGASVATLRAAGEIATGVNAGTPLVFYARPTQQTLVTLAAAQA
jgi:hypothetical protein